MSQPSTPQRITHRWLRFDPAPAGTKRILVAVAAEDTVAAEAFAQKTLLPLLFAKTPIELDFSKLRACTQSFVHALLFEALRLAWARKTPVFVSNVQPSVKATLELLENYALGG